MSRQTHARGRSPANGRGLHAPDRPPHTTRVCVYPAGLSPGGALRGPSGALRRTKRLRGRPEWSRIPI